MRPSEEKGRETYRRGKRKRSQALLPDANGTQQGKRGHQKGLKNFVRVGGHREDVCLLKLGGETWVRGRERGPDREKHSYRQVPATGRLMRRIKEVADMGNEKQ